MKMIQHSSNAYVAFTSSSAFPSPSEVATTETVASTEFVAIDGRQVASRSLDGGISIDDLIEQQDEDTRGRMVDAGKVLAATLAEKQPYNIRTLRLQKGWSQQELAEKAGMSQPQIARLERCIGDPRISTIQRLAAVLDANPEEIVAAWPTPLNHSELV